MCLETLHKNLNELSDEFRIHNLVKGGAITQ